MFLSQRGYVVCMLGCESRSIFRKQQKNKFIRSSTLKTTKQKCTAIILSLYFFLFNWHHLV